MTQVNAYVRSNRQTERLTKQPERVPMPDAVRWDPELIQRYGVTGPRYTSYPTAMQFHAGVGAFDLLHALRDSRKAVHPLSLYVHLPFCANLCYYCACNKIITKDRGRAQPYLASLIQEIELLACHTDSRQVVEQLHLGGGTPTFLSHDQLRTLMGALREHFSLLDNDRGDYAIEIDPREADWASMGLLRDLGFNRVSLGVQDLDTQVQRAINRPQSLEETRAIVEAARTLQFRSVNIDLIHGLPLQTPQSFARTLEAIITLQPDRIALYNYAHLPERFAAQRRIDSQQLPDPAQKLAMLQDSLIRLNAAGYRHIGMDHFALPDDDLAIAQEDGTLRRNFQGYSTHAHCDLIGLGVSAISQIGDLYCQNSTDLADYQGRLANAQLATRKGLLCDADDRLRRAVIQQLLCYAALDFASLGTAFAIDFTAYFQPLWPRLAQMQTDGLLELTSTHLHVTPAGRLVIRALCMLFDTYLQDQDLTVFSKVI